MKHGQNINQAFYNYLIIISIIIAFLQILLLLFLSNSGFELTDESYYLNSIVHFRDFTVSSTQFGLIYSPFYYWSSGNIAALRVINISLGLGISFLLGFEILRDSGRLRLPLSIGVAATSVTVVNGWLLTPSYNSLAVQSALLCMIGLSRVLRIHRSDFGAFIIGLAGWLSFMAKPTTAAALAILVFIALVITKKLNFRLIVVAGLVTLAGLLMSAMAIDGSVVAFSRRLQLSFGDRGVLQGYYLLNGDSLPNVWSMPNWRRVMALSAWVTIAMSGRYFRIKSAVMLIVFFGIAVCATIVVGLEQSWPAFLQADGFWRLAPFAIAIGLIAALGAAHWHRLSRVVWRKESAIIPVLLLLPCATALGSNVNYWIVGSSASIAWTLAGLRLASMVEDRPMLIAGALLAQLAVVVTIMLWIANPYRQSQSVLAQRTLAKVGESTLYVAKDQAKYLEKVHGAAHRSGFRKGMPMLDLTGHSPGTLFALGALPVAEPWLLGGYPGSSAFARTAIRRTPCQTIAHAWLLIEPGGPRSIKLEAVDVDASQFAVVARLVTPSSDYPGGREQLLLRPIGDQRVRTAACEATR